MDIAFVVTDVACSQAGIVGDRRIVPNGRVVLEISVVSRMGMILVNTPPFRMMIGRFM